MGGLFNGTTEYKKLKMAVIRCGRCQFDLNLITVEPVLFLYMIGSFLTYPTFQAFVFDKVCLDKYNQSFCDDLHNKTFQTEHKEEEDYVQSETSYWILKKNVVELVPSFLVVLFFLGSWGDKVGRKLPVILPSTGALLSAVCYLLMSLYPSSKIEYIYIGAVISGITGAYTAILMAVFSYITHIADGKNKSIRVGILESMSFFAGTVAVFVSGVMLDNTSFVFVFAFICGTYGLGMIYSIIRLENIKPDVSQQDQNLCDYWFLASLKETYRCVAKKREGKKKLYVFWLMFVFIVLSFGTSCEIDVLLLYTRRAPLSWSQTTYGYYKGLENFSRSITLVTILPLCKKKFHLRDTTIGVMGLVSKVIGLVIIGIATKTWLMFTVVVLAMFQGLPGAIVRSLMSTMVERTEQGRLFGLIGAIESVATILASVLFNELYPASLSFFPGFSFLLAAALCVMATFVMLWLRMELQGEAVYEAVEEPPTLSQSVHEKNEYGSTEDIQM